ncbi:undecaprenyl-diphosphate phosphatase [Asticcacaulis solisilvae]|uniref:undecaprenyl-diphosphate phosphatase n=1 Tax=Asticcacaulis solisilvae TaxID=1217274 RepID=UPI003FD6D89A
MHYLLSVLLGIIEGLTEFLPVSSTAHLLIAEKLMAFQDPGGNFTVMIQLGAILAVVILYFAKLFKAVVTLPTSAESRRFAISVLVAFFPAVIIGVVAKKSHLIDFLFDNIPVICGALIVGGVALWAVDKYAKPPVHHDSAKLDLKTSLIIGLFQCLAIIPGMSRSGSTLIGAMVCKVDKKAGAEFSFFLAIPTMLGAFVVDFAESHKLLTSDQYSSIAIGFVVAFLAALLVIKPFISFVQKRGYGFFALWRVVVGVAGLVWWFGFAHA